MLMPQPRKYATRAEQQAAYRHRRALSEKELLARKGLPPLPAIPTMPGAARWNAMIVQAHLLLSEAIVEMNGYREDRSEQWQESERGDEHQEWIASVESAVDALDGLMP